MSTYMHTIMPDPAPALTPAPEMPKYVDFRVSHIINWQSYEPEE
jgi:hypothetical protein